MLYISGLHEVKCVYPVNVTVLQQLLTAKSEVSSSVLIRQDAMSCGNGVEVVFILVHDDT